MTQQIINTGNVVNDGTGESLRNAFIAVNNNFTQIWAAGPVDSQVTITNNVISTNVTNLPLVLAGNGTATITVDSTVVPSIDSVYDLGSPAKRFDSAYAQYFYGNGRFLTGISGGSGGGNVTFSSIAPVAANIGDVWIESDTGVQYIYFNDNSSNQWAEMEAFQSFGLGSSGNGGNIDLTSVASDIVPSANNGYNIGNSTNQWNHIWAGNAVYINHTPLTVSNASLQFNGVSVLTTLSEPRFANLSVTGNVTTNAIYTNNYFYANGAPFLPAGNVLPNSTIRIAGNTISTTVLNQNLTLSANGVGAIQANSTILPSIDSVYDVGSPTRRMDTVYASYFVGNGAGLTGITATSNYANANVAAYLPTYTGNLTALTGNVTTTANITGNYFIGNGALLTGISGTANTGNIGFIGNAMYDLNGLIIENADLSHGATATVILPANGNSTNPLRITNTYGNILLTAGTDPGHLKSWTFNTTGTLSAPGNIIAANGVIQATGDGITTGLITGYQFLANSEQTGVTWNGYVFSGDGAETGLVQRQTHPTTVSLVATGAEVIRVTPTGANIFGYISAAGNVQVANLLTGGSISATGNVTSGKTIVTTPVALSTLTAVAGARAFVNDGNLVAAGNFGVQIGSSGANIVPVWSNGTNWYVG
jgi:hypothetical protein